MGIYIYIYIYIYINKKHNFCWYPVSYRIDFSSLSNSNDIINRAEVVTDSDNATFMKKAQREKEKKRCDKLRFLC